METLNGIPEILYKYRSWSDSYQKKLLTENQIYFAAPEQFNDPFDAALPYQYKEENMTPENVFRKLTEIEKKAAPHKSDAEIHAAAHQRQISGIFENGRYWQDFYPELKRIINRTFGICSLSSKRDNILMWSHYSDSHKGFVVGLDSSVLFHTARGQIGKVMYDMTFPKIELFDSGITDIIRLLYTKSPLWEYEDEYRISIARPKTIVTLPDSAFKEVVIGCQMPEHEKNAVTKLVKQKFKHAKLYEAMVSLYEFKLDLIPIL